VSDIFLHHSKILSSRWMKKNITPPIKINLIHFIFTSQFENDEE